MPAFESSNFDDSNEELCTPVVSIKEGLPVRELLTKYQTEFEVQAEEVEEDQDGASSIRDYFNFDHWMNEVNLDMLGGDDDDDESEQGTKQGSEQGTKQGSEQATEQGSEIDFFEKYRRKMINLREDGKIKKHIVKQGVGPLVPDNCLVYVYYQAYRELEAVPFDSTLWRCNGEKDLPVALNLGKGQLIPGLHEAILSMRKGEKAEFLIHYDLAFGKLGCGPRIPPKSTILFIVEVERFVDCGDIHVADDDLSMEERKEFTNVYKIAKGHHVLANDLFMKGNYSQAGNKYRQVINMMHNARLANEEEEKERNHFLIKIYTNACNAYFKLKHYKKVCSLAAEAVLVDPDKANANVKLQFYWGKAKMMLGSYGEAKNHLTKARNLRPSDTEIASALSELEQRKQNDLKRERMMMKRAFNFEPPSAKITEVNEEEESFRQNITEQLEVFKSNPEQDLLIMRKRFSPDEEKICLEVAKQLQLFARVADAADRIIEIRKPLE